MYEISNNRYDCYTLFKFFFYLKNTHSFSVLGIEFVRNQGIFWEPGVLQIFLNLILFIHLIHKKKRGIIFWMTIIALLTTFSTTGLVVMFIQLIISFASDVKKIFYFSCWNFITFISLLYYIYKYFRKNSW